mmetsp:Transcript_42669/g.103614  ORF Transcript_42669/g.103614 Transcript_42669/m.103614 type:complete len:228 (+) Transcript_42669:289-972(+)
MTRMEQIVAAARRRALRPSRELEALGSFWVASSVGLTWTLRVVLVAPTSRFEERVLACRRRSNGSGRTRDVEGGGRGSEGGGRGSEGAGRAGETRLRIDAKVEGVSSRSISGAGVAGDGGGAEAGGSTKSAPSLLFMTAPTAKYNAGRPMKASLSNGGAAGPSLTSVGLCGLAAGGGLTGCGAVMGALGANTGDGGATRKRWPKILGRAADAGESEAEGGDAASLGF